jgi:hypothetical protein
VFSLQLLTSGTEEEAAAETNENETIVGILWEATCFTTATKVAAYSDQWILRYRIEPPANIDIVLFVVA